MKINFNMKKQLFNLKNKIVVITGGSGFLGSEFSFSLSDIGAIPVILDKNKTSLEILKKKFTKKRKKGSILNIASDYGIISPDHRIYEPNKKINYKGVNFNTPISYSVAKSGIISMTKYLATYWAKKGIRVNCVSPTGVSKQKQDKQFVKQLSERIPLGRMAKSDELNGAIIYLCSNASSYVTGHNLVVDGGRTIW